MILPAVEQCGDGLRVRLHNEKGEYLGTGFVYPDSCASIAIDGGSYRLDFQVTWDW